MATREEVDRTLGAYEPGPDDPALADLMRGHLEAPGASVEPAGPFPATDGDTWTGPWPDREWLIPGWLPVGRLGMLSGRGGRGKSRLRVATGGAHGGQSSGARAIRANSAPALPWTRRPISSSRRGSMGSSSAIGTGPCLTLDPSPQTPDKPA